MLTDCIVNANHGLHQRTKTKQSLTAISIILIHKSIDLKKKSGTANFFLSEGVISRIFFRYIHKDKFLCIFSQMKNNAYLPVHLVLAPSFWWSPSYSFTFSFLCVFFQFLYVVRYICLRFLCFVFVSLFLDFPTFRFWACLMKVIPETRCAH